MHTFTWLIFNCPNNFNDSSHIYSGDLQIKYLVWGKFIALATVAKIKSILLATWEFF